MTSPTVHSLAELVEQRMWRRYRQPEGAVGRCEICGVVDHHLIAGECTPCRRTTATFYRLSPSEPAPDEIAATLVEDL